MENPPFNKLGWEGSQFYLGGSSLDDIRVVRARKTRAVLTVNTVILHLSSHSRFWFFEAQKSAPFSFWLLKMSHFNMSWQPQMLMQEIFSESSSCISRYTAIVLLIFIFIFLHIEIILPEKASCWVLWYFLAFPCRSLKLQMFSWLSADTPGLDLGKKVRNARQGLSWKMSYCESMTYVTDVSCMEGTCWFLV